MYLNEYFLFRSSSSDYGSQCRPSICEHYLSDGLSGDAESDEADCSGWNYDATAVASARPAIRECAGSGVDGGTELWTADVVDKRRANERLDTEWTTGGFGSVVGSTRGASFSDCRLNVVPEHGGHLREAPPELAAIGA